MGLSLTQALAGKQPGSPDLTPSGAELQEFPPHSSHFSSSTNTQRVPWEITTAQASKLA